MVAPELVSVGDTERVEIAGLAERLGLAAVVRGMEVLGLAQVAMREAPDPRVNLEVALVRLAHPDVDVSPEALVARIERLERGAPVPTTTGGETVVAPVAVPTARPHAPTAGTPKDPAIGDRPLRCPDRPHLPRLRRHPRRPKLGPRQARRRIRRWTRQRIRRLLLPRPVGARHWAPSVVRPGHRLRGGLAPRRVPEESSPARPARRSPRLRRDRTDVAPPRSRHPQPAELLRGQLRDRLRCRRGTSWWRRGATTCSAGCDPRPRRCSKPDASSAWMATRPNSGCPTKRTGCGARRSGPTWRPCCPSISDGGSGWC